MAWPSSCSIVELLNSLSFLSLAPLLRTTVVPSHGQQPLQQPPDWSKASPPGIAATTRESRPATLAFPFPQVSIFKPPPPPNLLQTTQPETGGGGGVPASPPPLLPLPPRLSFRVHTRRPFILSPNVLSHSRCLLSILHVFTEYLFIYLICVCVYIYIYINIYN